MEGGPEYGPIEGGDKPIRRLDTEVVNLVRNMLGKMNSENCAVVAGMVGKLLEAAERGRDETQDQYPGRTDT